MLEVAFNKTLRRIWNIPLQSHTATVHHVANLQSTFNIIRRQSAALNSAARVFIAYNCFMFKFNAYVAKDQVSLIVKLN